MTKKNQILFFVGLILLFGLVIVIENVRHDRLIERLILVDNSTSIEIYVFDVDLNHNDLIFNDSFLINTGNLINGSEELRVVWQLETPFMLFKEERNDTIRLSAPGKFTRYLTFKK